MLFRSRPEFINRIDDVVVFQSLGLADIEQIVEIQLKDVRKRLARERITLELSGAAIQSLSLDGLDPVYGARPLKRLIQRQVVDNVAGLIIDGKLHEGDTVRIDVGEGDRLVAVRDDEKSDNRSVAGSVSDPDGTPVEPDSFE